MTRFRKFCVDAPLSPEVLKVQINFTRNAAQFTAGLAITRSMKALVVLCLLNQEGLQDIPLENAVEKSTRLLKSTHDQRIYESKRIQPEFASQALHAASFPTNQVPKNRNSWDAFV